MYTILIPVDADETRALNQAKYVTSLPVDPDSVEIILAHAVTEPEDESRIAFLDSLFDWPPVREGAGRDDRPNRKTQSNPTPDRVASVRRPAEHLSEHGFEPSIEEIERPVDKGIRDLARTVGADTIVMGGRKRSAAGKALFGSVTQSVILNTELPVVVTGEE